MWVESAKTAYKEKNKDILYDLDTAVKTNFMVGILKSDHKEIGKVSSLLVHFLAWHESPTLQKWEQGLEIVYGWKAFADISEVLQTSQSMAESVLEVTKQKHFKEIILTIQKHYTIRQKDLALELNLEENNLLPKAKSLMNSEILEKIKTRGAVYLKLTQRGNTIAEKIKEQGFTLIQDGLLGLEAPIIKVMMESLESIPEIYRAPFAKAFAGRVESIITEKSYKNLWKKVEEITRVYNTAPPKGLQKKNHDELPIFLKINQYLKTIEPIVDRKKKVRACRRTARQFAGIFPTEVDSKTIGEKIENNPTLRADESLIRFYATQPAFYWSNCLKPNTDNREYLFSNLKFEGNRRLYEEAEKSISMK